MMLKKYLRLKVKIGYFYEKYYSAVLFYDAKKVKRPLWNFNNDISLRCNPPIS
jgi:hypothetical protein